MLLGDSDTESEDDFVLDCSKVPHIEPPQPPLPPLDYTRGVFPVPAGEETTPPTPPIPLAHATVDTSPDDAAQAAAALVNMNATVPAPVSTGGFNQNLDDLHYSDHDEDTEDEDAAAQPTVSPLVVDESTKQSDLYVHHCSAFYSYLFLCLS